MNCPQMQVFLFIYAFPLNCRLCKEKMFYTPKLTFGESNLLELIFFLHYFQKKNV